MIVSLLSCAPFISVGQVSPKEAARTAKVTPDLLRLMNTQIKQTPTKNARTGAVETNATAPNLPDEPETGGLVGGVRNQIKDGKIAITAVANDENGQALLTELEALGLTEGTVYERMVFGYLPIDKLGSLKDVATLRFARPAYRPYTNAGRVTTQGDRAMRADLARQQFNVTGAGQKVGILSDSYDFRGGAAAGVASDDLPQNVQVLDDFVEPPDRNRVEDEGRAMAELVHDVAPGAAIAFNTAFRGQPGFANGILNLAKAGCNIIVDDIYYLDAPFFQDGIVAQAVDRVTQVNKVSYFSAAGNYARASYQNAFVPSGRPAPGFTLAEGIAHNYLDGSILQTIRIPPGGDFVAAYQWDDPFYSVSGGAGARTDIDVYVYFQGRLIPQLSSSGPNIGGDPFEFIGITNTGTAPIDIQIAIVNFSGPNPSIIKWVDASGVAAYQYATRSSTIFGHGNAEGAIAVGAARATLTPAFNAARTTAVVEGFSSAGGTPILFNTRGQRIFPIVRQKPEIVAPDGGSTTFFFRLTGDTNGDGFPDFFGTSAAAPHAAAVAALMQQQSNNGLSPADVKTNLIRSAIDMDDPATAGFDVGFDFGTGNGFIQADRALAFALPFAVVQPLYDCATGRLTIQTANGNGSPIEYRIAGVTDWTTNPVQFLSAGLLNDANTTTLQIMARQNGQVVMLTFNFREFCRPVPGPVVPGAQFAIVQPLFNCQNGLLTVRTTVGNGSPIEYRILGVTDWTTNPVQVLDAGIFLDFRTTTLMIMARQSGQVVSVNFNFRAFCAANGNSSGARLATTEAAPELDVTVKSNPTTNDWADIEIRGAEAQPLKFRMSTVLGEQLSEDAIDSARPLEQHRMPLGRSPGLYLLQVSTPTQTKTIKLLRH